MCFLAKRARACACVRALVQVCLCVRARACLRSCARVPVRARVSEAGDSSAPWVGWCVQQSTRPGQTSSPMKRTFEDPSSTPEQTTSQTSCGEDAGMAALPAFAIGVDTCFVTTRVRCITTKRNWHYSNAHTPEQPPDCQFFRRFRCGTTCRRIHRLVARLLSTQISFLDPSP